jgi:hypothetical protein
VSDEHVMGKVFDFDKKVVQRAPPIVHLTIARGHPTTVKLL